MIVDHTHNQRNCCQSPSPITDTAWEHIDECITAHELLNTVRDSCEAGLRIHPRSMITGPSSSIEEM